MKFKIKEAFGSITKEQVVNLEKRLDLNFPDSYSDFLIENNGGRPIPNGLRTSGGEIETDIQYFFGITEGIYSIEENHKNLRDVISLDFIPIAIDSVGNFVVLNVISSEVFLLEHETLELFSVAYDFNKFIETLFPMDVALNELDRAIAIQNKHYFEVKKHEGIDLQDVVNEFNQSLTVIAALRNKLLLLKYFVEEGLRIEGALFNACSIGNLTIVQYLLSNGADPNERDEAQNNDTALIQASYGGYIEIVKLLIYSGADVYASDNFGQTALNKAYWSNSQQLIDYFENEIYI